MIGFDELELGMVVTVSDGTLAPGEDMADALRAWRSHNFTGVVSAIDDDSVSFDVEGPLSTITWTLPRSGGYTFVPAAPTDEQLNRALHAQIDAEAASQMPVQRQGYDQKLAEARGEPGPFLIAEAAARQIPVEDLAQMVIAAADQALARSAAIEAKRIAAKLAVTAAEGREAKEAAALVNWDA